MKNCFALLIVPNRKTGHVIAPYIITKAENGEFYKPKTLVTLQNFKELIPARKQEYTEQILKLISNFDDQTLFNKFSRKKQKATNSKTFFETLDPDVLKRQVRPYIEKQLVKCLLIAKENNIPLYRREERANLYAEDQVTFETEVAKTVFNFTKTEETLEYALHIAVGDSTISLFEKASIELSNDPCYIVIEDKIYHFPEIDGKKLQPFFIKKSITIPESFHQKYFEGFILNSIKKYPVIAKGFDIIENNVHPEFNLVKEVDLSGNNRLQLYAKYDGDKYLISDKTPFTVSFSTEPISYTKNNRKLKEETELEKEILNLCLQRDKQGFLVPKNDSTINQWIAKKSEKLKDLQLQLSTEEAEVIDLQKASITLQVNANKDWFDVDAIVLFGEQKVPFKTIRKHILKGDDQIKLPDGSIGIIPEEWFAEYSHLVHVSNENDNGITVNNLHIGVIPQEKQQSANKETYEKVVKPSELDSSNLSTPQALKAQLRPYQKAGYEWMYGLYKKGLGACLADDMGLGKTLQTLTMLAMAGEENTSSNNLPDAGTQLSLFDAIPKQQSSANLIVVPASLMHNWRNEIKKFLPLKKVFQYYGNNRIPTSQFKHYDFIIITYGLLRNVIDEFEKYEFLYVVLDESQAIKNPNSKIYKTVLRLSSQHKLALTGTPIENNLNDLWAQMNFINDGILGNQNYFKTTFQKPIEQQSESAQSLLQQMISPFILRRSKQEVATDLPSITEQYVYCSMNKEQAQLYDEEKSKARNLVYQSIETAGIGKSSFQILQAITSLRQIANHPVLFNEDDAISSGKFETICKTLETVIQENHKVLLFSSFVKHLDLFEQYLTDSKIVYEKLTGASRNREQIVNSFQNNSRCQVFLISLKAGGVGLNLTAADYVFMLDPWWNPAAEQQAISRAHRIGQDKPVFVYRFICEESIEEKIKTLQEKKSELADIFINKNTSALNMNDLELLLS